MDKKQGSKKATNYTLNFIAIIMFGIAGLILFWSVYPWNIISHYTLENGEYIEQTEQPFTFQTVQDEVRRGDNINFTFYYQKHYSVSGETIRELICGDNLITLTPFKTDLPVSDEVQTVVGVVEIPEKASLGECYLVYTTQRELNPLRAYTERFESNMFNIKE